MSSRQTKIVAKKQPRITQNICLFLKKLPLELRDQIYDYVAASETDIGLHVTLARTDQSKPQVHAYPVAGLGHTCKEIRAEYSLRLQRRIKNLLTETYQPYNRELPNKDLHRLNPGLFKNGLLRLTPEISRKPCLCPSARDQLVRVADRKVSKGVHVQDDVAMTTCIPFAGYSDHGLRTSFLTLTVATHPARAYNNKYDLVNHWPHQYQSEAYWKQRGDWTMLTEAITKFQYSLWATDWMAREFWFAVWWKYDMIFHLEDDVYENLGPVLRNWMGRLGDRVKRGCWLEGSLGECEGMEGFLLRN
jgi:hypothetical protein